jgi:hypothetical protein
MFVSGLHAAPDSHATTLLEHLRVSISQGDLVGSDIATTSESSWTFSAAVTRGKYFSRLA